MPQYHRLTVNEREEISLGLAQGRSRRDIAHTLGRYPSTISCEIKRNNNHASCYRAVESQATPGSAAKLIREVKYKTRKRVSSEDKVRIVP